MRKKSLLLVCILSLCLIISSFGCCSHLVAPSNSQRAELIGSETVALVHTYQDETHLYCSGVWVSQTVMMTANHCMEDLARRVALEQLMKEGGDPMMIMFGLRFGLLQLPYVDPDTLNVSFIVRDEVAGFQENPLALHMAKVLARDTVHDLALIQALNVPAHKVAALAAKTGAVGEKVYTMGHPSGLYWSFMEGVISAYHDHIGEVEKIEGPFMQIMMPIYHGNSGGGVFNDFGELEGIVSFMPGDTPNVGFCIGLKSIREFMAGQHLVMLNLK